MKQTATCLGDPYQADPDVRAYGSIAYKLNTIGVYTCIYILYVVGLKLSLLGKARTPASRLTLSAS